MFSNSTLTSLPSEKEQAIVFARNKHFNKHGAGSKQATLVLQKWKNRIWARHQANPRGKAVHAGEAWAHGDHSPFRLLSASAPPLQAHLCSATCVLKSQRLLWAPTQHSPSCPYPFRLTHLISIYNFSGQISIGIKLLRNACKSLAQTHLLYSHTQTFCLSQLTAAVRGCKNYLQKLILRSSVSKGKWMSKTKLILSTN